MSTPRHGHKPVQMRRVAGYDAVEKPGDFYWYNLANGKRYLFLAEPSTDAEFDAEGFTLIHIPVRQGKNEKGVAWGWDGNEDSPTITPSIHTVGIWHGWVRAGQLVEA